MPSTEAPAPPANTKTLAELDDDCFLKFQGKRGGAEAERFHAWCAGIAYERAEILEIVGDYTAGNECTSYDKLKAIYNRVKGIL